LPFFIPVVNLVPKRRKTLFWGGSRLLGKVLLVSLQVFDRLGHKVGGTEGVRLQVDFGYDETALVYPWLVREA
jgi:hypothetical protein